MIDFSCSDEADQVLGSEEVGMVGGGTVNLISAMLLLMSVVGSVNIGGTVVLFGRPRFGRLASAVLEFG